MLEEARLTEEQAIPVYTRHLDTAVFWLGMDEKDAGRVKRTLNALANDSRRHKEVVERLLEEIKGSDKNAF